MMLTQLVSRRLFSTAAQAAVYAARGVPASVVKLESQTLPEPKGNEILVKMLAAPVNPADINMVCFTVNARWTGMG